MKINLLQALGFLLVLIVITNMALFAAGKIKETLFWMVIIAAAVFAYFVLPRVKKIL